MNNKQKYNWKVGVIGENCSIASSAMSYSQLLNKIPDDTGVEVFGIKVSDMNIRGNEVEITRANLMKKINENEVKKRTVKPGSIVFPKRGAAIATNKKRISTHPLVLDPNLIAVVPSADVNLRFLYYWFSTFDLKSITEPGPTPQLNKKNLYPLKFPLPRINEQIQISNILTLIQKAIEQQSKIVEISAELKRSLMVKLFTQGLKKEPQRESEIGFIPESWSVVELHTITEKPQYGYTASAEKKGRIHFLRITDITDTGVNWDTVPFCNCSDVEFTKYQLVDNDIVFARIGATTGKSYLINNPPKAIFASYLIRVRANNEVFPNYLYYFFQSNQYWKQINSYKGTSLKGGVNGSILSKLLIPFTSIEEQKQIVEVFSNLDKKVQIAIKKKEALTDTFNSMLQRLMSGKLRVDNLNLN